VPDRCHAGGRFTTDPNEAGDGTDQLPNGGRSRSARSVSWLVRKRLTLSFLFSPRSSRRSPPLKRYFAFPFLKNAGLGFGACSFSLLLSERKGRYLRVSSLVPYRKCAFSFLFSYRTLPFAFLASTIAQLFSPHRDEHAAVIFVGVCPLLNGCFLIFTPYHSTEVETNGACRCPTAQN